MATDLDSEDHCDAPSRREFLARMAGRVGNESWRPECGKCAGYLTTPPHTHNLL
jgi:hypothetical protein